MALRALRTRAQAVAAVPQEAELAALKQKEKLPWGQLSVQEKTHRTWRFSFSHLSHQLHENAHRDPLPPPSLSSLPGCLR
jgi:hypothetical protein